MGKGKKVEKCVLKTKNKTVTYIYLNSHITFNNICLGNVITYR